MVHTCEEIHHKQINYQLIINYSVSPMVGSIRDVRPRMQLSVVHSYTMSTDTSIQTSTVQLYF